MSVQQISSVEVAAILGSDFPEYDLPTFAKVWEQMQVQRVWRRESDFLPDMMLEARGVLEFFLPLKALPAVPA